MLDANARLVVACVCLRCLFVERGTAALVIALTVPSPVVAVGVVHSLAAEEPDAESEGDSVGNSEHFAQFRECLRQEVSPHRDGLPLAPPRRTGFRSYRIRPSVRFHWTWQSAHLAMGQISLPFRHRLPALSSGGRNLDADAACLNPISTVVL